MKYLAFRIDTDTIKNHNVVHGYFVRGKSNINYNWDLLGEFDNIEAAKHYIKTIITNPISQIVYGPEGYQIHL